MTINLFSNYADHLPDSYSRIDISTLDNPHWIDVNDTVANSLGIDRNEIESQAWLDAISGGPLLPGMQPIAQVYAGHQFGGYSPQLGDGRGALIGEVADPSGNKFDLHVKGIGLTPYSRMGDGRAVLRSTIREYLASNAMYQLGIPSTRALALAGSDTPVVREKIERAALLIRVAETHIRFGHFEYFYYTNQPKLLAQLIDYTLTQHFPESLAAPNPVADMLTQVSIRTGRLIAKWQAAGFAHGVMNTDNMSIVGETLDYGPFGFLDDYDPNYICNHSDYSGRYAFDAQPGVAMWNLNCLARALSDHASHAELSQALSHYEASLMTEFGQLIRAKLGLVNDHQVDRTIIANWLQLLQQEGADYTHSFRLLSRFDEDDNSTELSDHFVNRPMFDTWATQYRARLQQQPLSKQTRQQQMQQINPKYILRNYLAQNAIDAAERGDYSLVKQLKTVLERPYDEQPESEHFAALPPDWGKKMNISCSS